MPTQHKEPAGQTKSIFGSHWRSDDESRTSNLSETSLVKIDASKWSEGVLLVDCTSVGTSATLTVRVYALDSQDARMTTPLVTRAISAATKSRDVITAPMGNRLEITHNITGQTGGTTAYKIEAQLKAN